MTVRRGTARAQASMGAKVKGSCLQLFIKRLLDLQDNSEVSVWQMRGVFS